MARRALKSFVTRLRKWLPGDLAAKPGHDPLRARLFLDGLEVRENPSRPTAAALVGQPTTAALVVAPRVTSATVTASVPQGQQATVRWRTGGTVDHVGLYLIDPTGRQVADISFNRPANGGFAFTVPAGLNPGSGYKVKVVAWASNINPDPRAFTFTNTFTVTRSTAPQNPAPTPTSTTATAGTYDGSRYVVYADSVKVNGSRSWRNNNSGNIVAGTFTAAHGGIGSGGRFAIFPDEQTGLNAMVALLKTSGYQATTLAGAIARWAPSSDGNNPAAYAADVSRRSGIAVNTPMSSLNDDQLRAMATAMRAHEGWSPGQTYTRGDANMPDWVRALIPGAAPTTNPTNPTTPTTNPTPTNPGTPGGGLQIDRTTSLRSVNYPDHLIRHRNSEAFIDPDDGSELFRLDSAFVVRRGLADGSAVSFESVNYPGFFLRHQNSRLVLSPDDGSDLFRQDASFAARPALAGGAGYSFESVNYPGSFLRHRNYEVWLDANDGSDLYRQDASFTTG